MAKRKKTKITAREPQQNRKKMKTLRRAAFQISEVRDESGSVSVDIQALDSEVAVSGKMAMFDNLFYMVKYHIEDQCEDLAGAIGNALKLRDKRGDKMAEVVGENITLQGKLNRQTAEIERIAKGLQVGTISPYAASKALKEVTA